MKIAIPTNDDRINNHFGHCDYFTLIDLDERDNVTSKSLMKSAPVCGCKSGLADELAHKGINLLLAGGIGKGAIQKLNANHIEVITGFSGTIDEVLTKWKSKDYQNELTICTEHEHNCSH